MRAVRSINNNIAFCVDSQGNEVIAMGKGIGFGEMPKEVSLDDITHTYYDVDTMSLQGIGDIPQDVMELAVSVAERAMNELPYQLSPNLVFTLADHLSFIIKRTREDIYVSMPLAYDVEQSYPDEYRIARQTVRRMRRTWHLPLRENEAAGIALNIINAQVSSCSAQHGERTRADEEMLEDITEIVENEFGITINRSSFVFSRYATHMNYLFRRLHEGKSLSGSHLDLYEDVRKDYPQVETCVNKIVAHVQEEWGCPITDEECLYVFIHVARLCAKE